MTKKDFEAIARVLQDVASEEDSILGGCPAFRVSVMFANMLASTNPRFDRDRFLRACQPGANVRARS